MVKTKLSLEIQAVHMLHIIQSKAEKPWDCSSYFNEKETWKKKKSSGPKLEKLETRILTLEDESFSCLGVTPIQSVPHLVTGGHGKNKARLCFGFVWLCFDGLDGYWGEEKECGLNNCTTVALLDSSRCKKQRLS